MSEKHELDYDMFCYQCEQTANGKGCTKIGICGKTSDIAKLQDLLIYQLKGISCYGLVVLENDRRIEKGIVSFIENSLFTTLTNVNFDVKEHIRLLKESQSIKENLREKCNNYVGNSFSKYTQSEYALYNLANDEAEMLSDAVKTSIMYDESVEQDIRSLRQTIIYGLKGISAYGHQARELGYYSDEVDEFYIEGLCATIDKDYSVDELIRWTMRTGEIALSVLKVLDEANTKVYCNPVPSKVNLLMKEGPFIIVSGHDLKDLEMILEQTKDKGINVYTHGEMLPCHGYPNLNKYPHLLGNFGGAWQEQQKEFDNIPGCIVMTTNCLMKPRQSYKDRIFSTNVVGWEGVRFIPKDKFGNKDFSEVIKKSLELGGYSKSEIKKMSFKEQNIELLKEASTQSSKVVESNFVQNNYKLIDEIVVGFGHEATLSYAEKIVDLVKKGKIKHFFVIGGCDGARVGRNYYTEFARLVPKDCIILTLACGKYRLNKFDYGDIEGIPRLLDVGQCNDVYSAVRIATALADAFQTDVNSLPLSIILSWYEQKAVADLLALLSIGVKDIFLGPLLPAFLSPKVLQYLNDTFGLRGISNPEDDIKTCLNAVG